MSINQSYYNLKNFLNNNLNNINNLLNKTAEETFKILNTEYEIIYNKSTNISKKYSNIKYNITHKNIIQNKDYFITANINISEFIEYSEFNCNITLEGDLLKKPKIKCDIIDKSHPKEIIFKLSIPFGECGEKINETRVLFNNINYSLNFDYNTENNINITYFINFEEYKYSTEIYQMEGINEIITIQSIGIQISKCINRINKLINNYMTIVSAKDYIETTNYEINY